MASGIDSAAHLGALEAGGNTIAVFGTGIDRCYPSENRRLKKRIEEHGLILSEYPEGQKAARWTFPRRNRIISGLCETVVICEAGFRSGALNTAEHAAEQGRRVLAVPGRINSQMSVGTNKLIRDGCEILTSIEDAFDGFEISHRQEKDRRRLELSEDEQKIYDLLADGSELTPDEICRRTMLSPAYLNGIITVLEMKGIIVTDFGRVFLLK